MQLIDKRVKIFDVLAHRFRYFFVGCGAAEFLSELGIDFLEIFAFLAKRPRSPIEISQAVEDRSTYADFGIRLELHIPLRLKLLDSVKQSQNAGIDQVSDLDIRGQPDRHAVGDVLDQRKCFVDQCVSFGFGHIAGSTGRTYCANSSALGIRRSSGTRWPLVRYETGSSLRSRSPASGPLESVSSIFVKITLVGEKRWKRVTIFVMSSDRVVALITRWTFASAAEVTVSSFDKRARSDGLEPGVSMRIRFRSSR